MKKHILITGYGYVARRLLPLLKNHRVISLSRTAVTPEREYHREHRVVDFDQAIEIKATLSIAINTVLYLLPPPNSGMEDTRVRNFLHSSLIQPQSLKKFILISTTGVYGDCSGRWIDENEPLNPQADRAKRRVDAEQQCRVFCRNNHIDLTILRVAGIYAEDKLPLDSIKQRKPIINKNEAPYSNRIHADDLCQICLKAIEEHHPGIYNCCDSAPSTMSDYFSGLASVLGLEQPPVLSMAEAQKQLSRGMLSYLSESRRISNKKLIKEFRLELNYPQLEVFLKQMTLSSINIHNGV